MKRPLVLFGALALLVPIGFSLVGGPARAVMQPGITVSLGTTSETDYGPIVANFPAGAVVVPTPSGCGVSNPDPIEGDGPVAPFEASCDTIPLHIVEPTGLGDQDDYFVTVEVAWDNPTGQDDLDAYVWDNQQIVKRQDPEGSGYTQINSSTSADQNPEVVKLFHPTLGDYNIVVINSSGPNLGYSIKAYMTIARGDAIFELLDPTAPANNPAPAAEPPAPIDYSADPGLGAIFTPPASALGEIAVLPDDDLESDFGQSTFQEAIAPPQSGLARFSRAEPGSASGVAVTLSLIVLPLLAAVAAVFALRRRGKFGAGI